MNIQTTYEENLSTNTNILLIKSGLLILNNNNLIQHNFGGEFTYG